MGCISSKLLATADLDQEIFFSNNNNAGDYPNHVVSLTSSTYGALKLDRQEEKGKEEEGTIKEWKRSPPVLIVPQFKKRVEEQPEIINAWELMEDLDDEIPIWSPAKKPTKSCVPVDRIMSPMKQKKKFVGKENKLLQQGSEKPDPDPNRVLKPFSSSENAQFVRPASTIRRKNSPIEVKINKPGNDSGVFESKQGFSPLFDPELLASFEKELREEGEQIKMIVSPLPKNRKARDMSLLLRSFKEKCPPGGENTVVLYTTTLRGIRKTFEECNAVRSVIEFYDVRIVEKDISMDSGFREELRVLMEKKEVRVPVVFVKGRLIGGAEEVLQLEDEGKLGLLLEGIPRAVAWCEGCGGLRFVMCMDCNGSCKVLDEEQKKMVKCGECNENGLIHCPICC